MNSATSELAMFASQNHPMTYTKAVVSSIVGLLGIAMGVLNDKFYYAKGLYGGVGRPAPIWCNARRYWNSLRHCWNALLTLRTIEV